MAMRKDINTTESSFGCCRSQVVSGMRHHSCHGPAQLQALSGETRLASDLSDLSGLSIICSRWCISQSQWWRKETSRQSTFKTTRLLENKFNSIRLKEIFFFKSGNVNKLRQNSAVQLLQKGDLLFFTCAGTWHPNLHVGLLAGRKCMHYAGARTSSKLHMLFNELSPTVHNLSLDSDTTPLPQVPGGWTTPNNWLRLKMIDKRKEPLLTKQV